MCSDVAASHAAVKKLSSILCTFTSLDCVANSWTLTIVFRKSVGGQVSTCFRISSSATTTTHHFWPTLPHLYLPFLQSGTYLKAMSRLCQDFLVLWNRRRRVSPESLLRGDRDRCDLSPRLQFARLSSVHDAVKWVLQCFILWLDSRLLSGCKMDGVVVFAA